MLKPRQPPPYQVNVEYGQFQNTPSGGGGGGNSGFGVGGTASISDLQTFVDIPIPGMTATGMLAIEQLAPTGSLTDTDYTQLASAGNVRVSVGTAPGVGNKFNFTWAIERFA